MDTTMKVEYIAALVAAKEGVWVKKFVNELGVDILFDNSGNII